MCQGDRKPVSRQACRAGLLFSLWLRVLTDKVPPSERWFRCTTLWGLLLQWRLFCGALDSPNGAMNMWGPRCLHRPLLRAWWAAFSSESHDSERSAKQGPETLKMKRKGRRTGLKSEDNSRAIKYSFKLLKTGKFWNCEHSCDDNYTDDRSPKITLP